MLAERPSGLLARKNRVTVFSTEYQSTSLAILTWLPLVDVEKKFEILRERMEEFEDSRNRDEWSKHPLYKKSLETWLNTSTGKMKQVLKVYNVFADIASYDCMKTFLLRF